MGVFVAIPVYNRIAFTANCLKSLNKQTEADFEIIVMDDGSTDGTSEMISDEYPDVHLLQGDGSLFWTASINACIRKGLELGASAIITLNNDVIASPDYMENMLSWHHKEGYENALIGSLALDSGTKKVIYGGERINWSNGTSENLLDILPEEEQMGLHEVTHFPGRGMLIPRKVFEKIGLFDEKRLPQYYADYDFTHRAVRNGFKLYCNYDAKLYTYPTESGDYQAKRAKSLSGFYNYFFGMKSSGNLAKFSIYTWKNCPRRFVPQYLLIGYIRRIGGYFREWFKS